ncbi:MAG: hypothetical protein ACQETH_00525 [Candidatus Rifleibacteriota bacterium]
MENKSEFTIKRREDVIDTLRLRAKERTVLIGLIIILICTLVYENSTALNRYFLETDHEVPQLGERKKIVVKPAIIKELKEKINPVINDFPQFTAMFKGHKNELDRILLTLKKDEDKATKQIIAISKELYRFATHPVIEQNDNLEEIEKVLNLLQRKLKVKFDKKFKIVPVTFVKGERTMPSGVKRNLFNYETY